MLPSGPNNHPMGMGQSASPSLLRSNSGIMGAQASPMSSQSGFPPLMSPNMQYNNMNFIGNVPNISSLLNQPYGNGGSSSDISGLGGNQRVGMDTGAESDSLGGIGNGMGFTPSSAFTSSNMGGLGTSSQNQGQQFHNSAANQLMQDQQHSLQVASRNFQQNQQGSPHQFSGPQNSQHPQQQFQVHRNGLGGVGHVKSEPQASNDSQQGHNSRNHGPVKMETQIQGMRGLPPIKMEQQHSEQSLFIQQQQQQQQQQQLLHLARQSPQNLLGQQRLMQIQHQQHNQQLLKNMPPQRSSIQSQFPNQSMPLRAPIRPVYEPGTCARRLTHYMYQQQHRPEDNNIEFWRKFVAEYFAPHAKKKWCVSMYGNGRQTTGVFPQDVWHCEICNRKPGRGFEATVEVLPRLFKIKYESGTLEELLYVDMPREYQNSCGQIVLDYAKAIQESVFDQLRVVRDGQLRIVFNPDLKICSWEFCARRHEELMPRRLLIPQVSQLGAAAQKYQAASQNASSSLSIPELQNNCNMFVSSARQLAKALEVPLVNDLGYTKRYVRCLQISEVVNSMKDLIDYSRLTGIGPMESLTKFPRRTNAVSNFNDQGRQHEDQQPQQQQALGQSSNDPTSGMQLPVANNTPSVNTKQAQATPSSSTIAGLLHQNSMNSRQHISISNANSPYGGNCNQVPSPGSSSTMPAPSQPNSSPFNSPTPSSNNLQAASHGALTSATHMSTANPSTNISAQPSVQPVEAETNESQSSVQKIIQDMLMNSQLSGNDGMMGVGSMVSDLKTTNVMPQLNNNSSLNGMIGNGTISNHQGSIGPGFGSMGGIGQSNINGIRAAMGSNSVPLNGRMAMASTARDRSLNHQQQDIGNQLLNGLGAVNGFNNLQFDWKGLP